MEMLVPRNRVWGAIGGFLRKHKCLLRSALWDLRVLQALAGYWPPRMGPTAKLGKIQVSPSRVKRDPTGGGDSEEKRVESGVGE